MSKLMCSVQQAWNHGSTNSHFGVIGQEVIQLLEEFIIVTLQGSHLLGLFKKFNSDPEILKSALETEGLRRPQETV